jgi:hypothetical protein
MGLERIAAENHFTTGRTADSDFVCAGLFLLADSHTHGALTTLTLARVAFAYFLCHWSHLCSRHSRQCGSPR